MANKNDKIFINAGLKHLSMPESQKLLDENLQNPLGTRAKNKRGARKIPSSSCFSCR